MEPQQALPQFTSFSLRETAQFLRHLANACEQFEQTGTLPPPLFAARPVQAPSTTAAMPPPQMFQQPPRGYGVGPFSGQPIPPPGPTEPGRTAEPAPRQRKKRRTEKRTRAPTGYNLFVRQKLQSLKQEGTYAKFADSKVRMRPNYVTLPGTGLVQLSRCSLMVLTNSKVLVVHLRPVGRATSQRLTKALPPAHRLGLKMRYDCS